MIAGGGFTLMAKRLAWSRVRLLAVTDAYRVELAHVERRRIADLAADAVRLGAHCPACGDDRRVHL